MLAPRGPAGQHRRVALLPAALGPGATRSSRTLHSGVSPSGRSNSDRRPGSAPATAAAPSRYAAASTSPGATSGAAATDTTARPARPPPWPPAGPSPGARSPRPPGPCRRSRHRWPRSGERSTRVSEPAQPLAAPRAAAGVRSNGSAQEIRVASALARASTTCGVTRSGNRSISPRVCSRAQSSSASCSRQWTGRGPRRQAGVPVGQLGGLVSGAVPDGGRGGHQGVRLGQQGGRGPGGGRRVHAEHVRQFVPLGTGRRRSAERQQQPRAERGDDVVVGAGGGVQAFGVPGEGLLEGVVMAPLCPPAALSARPPAGQDQSSNGSSISSPARNGASSAGSRPG